MSPGCDCVNTVVAILWSMQEYITATGYKYVDIVSPCNLQSQWRTFNRWQNDKVRVMDKSGENETKKMPRINSSQLNKLG